MCPSITCPSCSQLSLHRGTCESCAYDPASSRWVDPGPLPTEEFAAALWSLPSISAHHVQAPFLCLRFESSAFADIDELCELTGYRGSIFTRLYDDLFSEEPRFGFDLVKDLCIYSLPALTASP